MCSEMDIKSGSRICAMEQTVPSESVGLLNLWGYWICCLSSYVGSTVSTAQVVPLLKGNSMRWQVLHISARDMQLCQLLLGELPGMCSNEVTGLGE